MTINRAMMTSMAAGRRWAGAALAPAIVGLALGMAAAAPASATVTGTLAFTQPTGVVGPTDVVPVLLTLTLDQTSDALSVSNYTITSGGPSDAELIAAGFDLSQAYTTNLNVFFQCGGTFNSICLDPPPYRFDFSFENYAEIDIAAGDDYTFAFGAFTPDPGAVPAGSYIFYNAGIFVQAFGLDLNGDPLHHDFAIANTCDNENITCAFTRTVVGGAVPEPATWAMMVLGFGGMGAMLRRRRQALRLA